MIWLMWAAIVIVCLGAIPANLVPLIYSRRNWTSTEAGRSIMFLWCSLGLLYDISLLRVWWHNEFATLIVSIVIYVMTAVALYYLLFLLLRSERYRVPRHKDRPSIWQRIRKRSHK